jgi:hypothetical protein
MKKPCEFCGGEVIRKGWIVKLATVCTECVYRQKYKRTNKSAAGKRAVHAHRQKCRAFVAWIKGGIPCTDCYEYKEPRGMDFDHLPGYKKTAKISYFAGQGMTIRLLEELLKTELVCRPCHRKRHRDRKILNDSAL